MRDIREELEQEASFWREMLEQKGNEIVLQRVREALLLIEYKLAQLDTAH